MRNNIAQGARGRLKLPDCKSTLRHLTSYGIWANYLTSLWLSFIFKIRLIRVTDSHSGVRIKQVNMCEAQHLAQDKY